ncbi:MAG: DUF4157 domain-containing protein [Allosphingosinicella sp.]
MSDGIRPLRPGEIALLEPAFGSRIPYEAVRLRLGHGGNPAAMAAFRNGNTAITLRRRIYFRTDYSDDFSTAPALARSLLHHEMVHVWQYASHGVVGFLLRYAHDLAACRFRSSAVYRYKEGKTPFAAARLEAQAQMVGDYCLADIVGDTGRKLRLAQNLRGSGFFGF